MTLPRPSPEALAGLGLLLGWALVTWALTYYLPSSFIIPLSAGILSLGLVGFRLVARLVVNGLYLPAVEDADGEETL